MSTPVKPPTLSDVARLAGVSVPTASRVLNGGVRGRRSGSPEMRERVERAAQALGYSVSPAAQAIKDGFARTVALIVSDINDFGAATMISGVMHACEPYDLSVAVRTTHDDPLRELTLLESLRGERHRAVIIATSRTDDAQREAALEERLRVIERQGTKVVIIGNSDLPFPSVVIDNRAAAACLAQGIVDGGPRRFAIVTGPSSEITARDRTEGFLEGLASRGIEVPEDLVLRVPFSRDGGYRAAGELVDRLDEVDVIAAMSDTMVAGVVARMFDAGKRVPTDVEVTGFDHVSVLGDVLPRFSTVEVPFEDFGKAALSLVMAEESLSSGRVPKVGLEAVPIIRGVRQTV